jgi:hypothetical protein
MRQIRGAKRRPRPATWPKTPLPPDPRDPHIVRAHQISHCQISLEPTTRPTLAPCTGSLDVVPGAGSRHRHGGTTGKVPALKQQVPDLIILPAHDPTAAARLPGT